jgi:hypothetical protein
MKYGMEEITQCFPLPTIHFYRYCYHISVQHVENGGKLMQGFVRRVLEKSDDRTGCERERWRELVQDRVQL